MDCARDGDRRNEQKRKDKEPSPYPLPEGEGEELTTSLIRENLELERRVGRAFSRHRARRDGDEAVDLGSQLDERTRGRHVLADRERAVRSNVDVEEKVQRVGNRVVGDAPRLKGADEIFVAAVARDAEA